MPHLIVKPNAGDQKKTRLAEEITKAVTSVLKSGEQSVLVGIEDVAPADWVEKVYRPNILDKQGIIGTWLQTCLTAFRWTLIWHGTKTSFAKSLLATICTSRRSVPMGRRTARRPGFGPLSWTTLSMCGPTTADGPAGTRLPWIKRRGVSLPRV
jgi:4-oxalocrotonate tautomerase